VLSVGRLPLLELAPAADGLGTRGSTDDFPVDGRADGVFHAAMKVLVRAIAIVVIALGTGLLTYGVKAEQGEFRAPAGIRLLSTPSETAAWGAGILVAAVLMLVLFGRGRAAAKP